MTEKLIDIFGTKYFYITFRKDLDYFVGCIMKLRDNPQAELHALGKEMSRVFEAVAKGDELIVDIAEAEFTPDTVVVIYDMLHKGIKVVDTLAKWRNSIIAENIRRFANVSKDVKPLPELTFTSKVTDYIAGLSTEEVYTNASLHNRIVYPLTALITAVRPDVKIELYEEDKFFRYVNGKINPSDFNKYTKFYVNSAEGTRIFDFAEGCIHVQGEGLLDQQQALSTVTLVPADFGTVPTISNPVYSTLIRDAMNRIRSYQNQRPKTIAELFER